VDSNVYIVRKGAPVEMREEREVFSADPMTGAELVWKRDHLLEIHYDIAEIHSVRGILPLRSVTFGSFLGNAWHANSNYVVENCREEKRSRYHVQR